MLMLTRAQIQQLARRNHIGIQVQERDYLQHLLLSRLYARPQGLILKGGTALRLVYQGNRYSEDLDFNGPDDVDALRDLWRQVIADLKNFGIQAEVQSEWESEADYGLDVSYQGPLYDGHDRQSKIRLDVNRQPEPMDTRRKLVTSEYDDVGPFVVTVLTVEHLMAEKIRHLWVRGKPRDLYDVWSLLQQGVLPDQALIEHKLAPYGMAFSIEAFEEILARVRADWEHDLRPLLPKFVEYEDVRRGLSILRR
jgi:predicted nucleotidyltransferase component of viral defense system